MTSNFWIIAPYVGWMALMTLLPSTPWAYAVRTLVTIALLFAGCRRWNVGPAKGILWGFIVGLAVLVIWILPEQFNLPWYYRYFVIGEGGTQAIAESNALMIAIRLCGSAFVISIAEELFFRKWLIPFAGFWWMVALFAIEHDRYFVGALAGIIYGALYLKRGFWSAVVAHATTNLALGIWVLTTQEWQFW